MKYSSKTIIVFLCFFSAYGAKKSSVLKNTANTVTGTVNDRVQSATKDGTNYVIDGAIAGAGSLATAGARSASGAVTAVGNAVLGQVLAPVVADGAAVATPAVVSAPTAFAAGAGAITAAAAVIGGVGAGIARGAMARNCKKLCSAYFTQEARDNNQTGTVYYNHVGAKVKGTIFKNRICKCTYGNKKAKFNHRDKRGPLGKIYKAMCKAGRDGKCNVQTTTCLINAPRACVYALADK